GHADNELRLRSAVAACFVLRGKLVARHFATFCNPICHSSTAPQRETEPAMSEFNAQLHLEAWIEVVTQAAAEQIEGEYCNADGNAREQNHTRRLTVKVSGIARQHQAPGRSRLLYAEPQKRQRCLRQDRRRDERGQHDAVITGRSPLDGGARVPYPSR